MKTLFEILNKLKLIHDFLMWPAEASRIADCFSHDEQTSTAGVRGARRTWAEDISDIFSHTQILGNQYPVQSDLMLLHITQWHWEEVKDVSVQRASLHSLKLLAPTLQHGSTPSWSSNWTVLMTHLQVHRLLLLIQWTPVAVSGFTFSKELWLLTGKH